MPITVNGQPSGTVIAPAGNILPVVKITPQMVSVTFGSSTQDIPITSTDLKERVENSPSWADPKAKAKQDPEAAKPAATAAALAAMPTSTPNPNSTFGDAIPGPKETHSSDSKTITPFGTRQ